MTRDPGCLQPDFSSITFSLVGDGKATRFFKINPDTGLISVARSLLEDNDLVYVVRSQGTVSI